MNREWLFKAQLFAALFFTLGSSLLMGCVGPRDEDIQIHPQVKYQGNVLTIINPDSFDYYGVKLRLNDGVFRMDLSMPILAGKEFSCNLSDLVKSDGERFNIFRYKPTDLSISCQVVQTDRKDRGPGKAFYYGRF